MNPYQFQGMPYPGMYPGMSPMYQGMPPMYPGMTPEPTSILKKPKASNNTMIIIIIGIVIVVCISIVCSSIIGGGGGYYFFIRQDPDEQMPTAPPKTITTTTTTTTTQPPTSKLKCDEIDINCIKAGINLIIDLETRKLFEAWFITRTNATRQMYSSRIQFTDTKLLKLFKNYTITDIEKLFTNKKEMDLLYSILDKSLVGWYNISSFNEKDKIWYDLSGQNNNATTKGCTIKDGAIIGTTSSSITFPPSILPTQYTLVHVSKYNGTTSKRIFVGKTQEYISGHDNDKTGVAYYGTLVSEQISETLQKMNEFAVHTSTNNQYFYNNINKTASNIDSTKLVIDQLAVNPPNNPENSDFAIGLVLVYSKILSVDDIKTLVTNIQDVLPLEFKKTEGFSNTSTESLPLILSELTNPTYSFI